MVTGQRKVGGGAGSAGVSDSTGVCLSLSLDITTAAIQVLGFGKKKTTKYLIIVVVLLYALDWF